MELTKIDFYFGAAIIIILGIGIYLHLRTTGSVREKHQSLGISDLIDSVRKELALSEEGRIKRGEPALFTVDKFDLDIKFVVNKSTSNSGKMELSVVTLDGGKTESSELVQTIHLEMKAIPPVPESSAPNKNLTIDTTGVIDVDAH